jgi:gamma-glutamylcyclotransferase (GGCT)/AIG2-like uncharacterized protein YtfP
MRRWRRVKGWAQGRLWAVPDPEGWYPALLPGEGRVTGMLHRPLAIFDVAMLAAMDRYEGEAYRRLPITVTLASGAVRAQAYVWQGALPAGAVALEDGDFAAFSREAARPLIAAARSGAGSGATAIASEDVMGARGVTPRIFL